MLFLILHGIRATFLKKCIFAVDWHAAFSKLSRFSPILFCQGFFKKLIAVYSFRQYLLHSCFCAQGTVVNVDLSLQGPVQS